jgi:methionine-rich copper-binding protein CopC
VLLLIVAVALLAPASAGAHARLLHMIPADGAELDSAPAAIDLWFNELLDQGFNGVEVFPIAQISAPHPENHTTGPARMDRKDRTHLQCPVGPLDPGEWVVQWRVLSRDGHPARGRTTFRIRAAN